MSFFNEVSSLLGFDAAKLATGYQIINYNGEAVYVEGFKRVAVISDTEIILELKKGKITLKGSDLKITLLESTSVIVKGKITLSEAEVK